MLLVPKYKYQEDVDFKQADNIMMNTFKENRKRKERNCNIKRWKVCLL